MGNKYMTLFNDGWIFCKTDIDAALESTFGEKWYNVEIPHDWLINDTKKLYETGCGWYKKNFILGKEDLSKNIVVYFEGVYMDATVYINGKSAFEWKYGYSSFEADITDFVKEGVNEIIVSVRHRSPNTRWYSGAGIFRSVWLKKRNVSHITTDGIYISTRKSEINWLVNIETEVTNATVDMNVRHTIMLCGEKIAEAITEKGSLNCGITVREPKLWSVDEPNVYTLVTELLDGDRVLDAATNSFGFKEAVFDCNNGFSLNGKPMKLHGVCMHHDLGALGSALNYTALERQLTIMKKMGVNAIRTSHNMPAVELMEICDRIGLLVDSEAFDMWEKPKTEFDYARFFPEWSERDVASWVRRDRNHPSVIMWSIGNEIYDTHASERGFEVTKMLKSYVLKNDPRGNAHVTIGSNFMPWENAQKCADEVKFAGYNYAERLYDEHHDKYPDWVIYGSETASAVRSRGVYHFPVETPILTHDDLQCSDLDNSVVGWGSSAQNSWKMDINCKFCCGQFIWTGFDYIGEPTPYSTKNSYFGIVDTAGLPKDIYYYYMSAWTSPKTNPMIHILPYWDFNDGEEIDVILYTNGAEAELFLDNVSLGRKAINHENGDNTRAEYKVKYQKGTLRAVAYDENGNVIAEDMQKSFDDAEKILLKADRTEIKADGRDLVFVEISTADKEGNYVANARNRVKVKVSGNARLVGLDNGDSTDYDSYKGDNRRLFSGKLIAIIEAKLTAGEIKVNVTSVGLDSAELTFNAVECEKQEGISVVESSVYPFAATSYTDEVPVRKIELRLAEGVRELDEKNKTAIVIPEIFPKNATYSDLYWKAVKDNGVEINYAEVAYEDGKAIVTAKGDGKFRLRAFCNNGGSVPQVFSDISFSVSGLGDAIRNPYKFTSACLVNLSNVTVNTIENGALGGFDTRTEMTYTGIDFGKYGSDTLTLHIGNSTNAPVPVELWDGKPDGDKLIKKLMFAENGRWDGFSPETFTLDEKLAGVHDLTIVISERVIFGGFEFAEKNKAFEKLYIGDNDGLYGDDYKINRNKVENIGNNVIFNFNEMNFADGVSAITVYGRTPNKINSIQIRYTPTGVTEQNTQLIEFSGSSEYTEQKFPLEKISGLNDVSFIFLPGSNFDFDWFRFE